MTNHLPKKIIIFLLLFFLGSSHNTYAQTLTVTETVTVSAQVGEEVVVTPGGGSSGGVVIPQTAVRFSGSAYPNALVTLLKEGEEKMTVQANNAGDFTITLAENYDNRILFSLFAVDVLGNRSLIVNYPIVVQVGFLTHLSGIRFAPTIVTDKAEVSVEDYLTVTGYALPNLEMEIIIDGRDKRIFSFTSSKNGSYKIVLPLSMLPKGDYVASVRYLGDTRMSKLVKFIIGELNIYNFDTLLSIPGDCNTDKIINLIDFSVLAFWYGKDNPPLCVDTNNDNKIDLTDFSILAFYWTG
ncbi:MAG: hypothetical protein Q8O46_04105 [bacterium]|nr:hypothetical protein [bacterium]